MQLQVSKQEGIINKIYVLPEIREYTDTSLKYYRYVCPICEKSGVVYGLKEKESNCPICGVRLSWKSVLIEKSQIVKSNFFDLKVGYKDFDKTLDFSDDTKNKKSVDENKKSVDEEVNSEEFKNKLELLRSVMDSRKTASTKSEKESKSGVEEYEVKRRKSGRNKKVKSEEKSVESKVTEIQNECSVNLGEDIVCCETDVSRKKTVYMFRLYDRETQDYLGTIESTSSSMLIEELKSRLGYDYIKAFSLKSVIKLPKFAAAGGLTCKKYVKDSLRKIENTRDVVYLKIKKKNYMEWLELNEEERNRVSKDWF